MRAFLLGSAAVLLPCAASAADLPVAEPVEYVRICDAFGAGFFYLPGTDTCLKLGGRVRAELHWVDGDPDVLIGGGPNSEFNNFTTRARANVRWDSRTSTELGLVRAYIDFETQRGPVDYTEPGVEPYPDEFELLYAFIEVTTDHGIFTAGTQDSFFDFYSSDDFGTRIDIDDNTDEFNVFAYSFVSPGGWKATLSLEDPDSSGRRLDGADDYEGLEAPDLVGALRVEQAWGKAQVMGVVGQIHDVNGDGLGWAAGAGVSINLPMIKDATFGTQFGYADGRLGYITTDPGGIGDFDGPDGEDTNQAWMGRGGFYVPLTATIAGWLDGSFTHAENNTGDDEYDYWAVVAGASWTPAEGLLMGPEFGYNNIDGDDAGEDGELWGLMWRFEREF